MRRSKNFTSSVAVPKPPSVSFNHYLGFRTKKKNRDFWKRKVFQEAEKIEKYSTMYLCQLRGNTQQGVALKEQKYWIMDCFDRTEVLFLHTMHHHSGIFYLREHEIIMSANFILYVPALSTLIFSKWTCQRRASHSLKSTTPRELTVVTSLKPGNCFEITHRPTENGRQTKKAADRQGITMGF